MSSVGRISLDLGINSRGFNRQVDGIRNQASRAFGTLSVAVGNIISNMVTQALGSIGNFVKDSIDKGSELAELQNVVDSVFTTMSDKVETFSQNALANYGLTEAQSKKMIGTFGAMSKSFGYTEKQAYDMSAALVGLTADVASFYNLSHDEAYTKMKSVFTGETESLKELGVVMTQSALDQFALAKGFGKTTDAMNEQEKVALRFAFVQDQLQTASGDFLKTQDQWANQTRILTGQFDSFKAALGQGFINVLTPVIRALNTLMGKLVQVANAFKSFTEMIMGVKSSGGSGAAMKDVADAANEAASATGGIESSAQGAASAAKKAQKALLGFDEINKLTKNDDAGAGSGAGTFEGIDFGGAIASQEQIAEKALSGVHSKVSEIILLLKEGFKSGLGSDFEASLKRTKDHTVDIGKNLREIFTDKEVVKSAETMVGKIIYAFGQVLGSFTSIGATIGELITGGIARSLQQNKGFIKDRLIGIMDVSGDYYRVVGELSEAVGSIFEVFRGLNAKQIGADLIGIFTNASLGITEVMSLVGHDVINLISQPIIENKDKIKTAIESTLKPISRILSTLNKSVKKSFEKILEVYEEYVKPAFENFTNGLSQVVGTVLDTYNTHIAPLIDRFAQKLTELWESYIQPALDKAITVVGKVIEVISLLWENVLAPLISWIIENVVPNIIPILETVGNGFINVAKSISQVIDGILSVIGGLIDFIVGVFTGDWSRAWDGVTSIFKGVKETISGILDGIKSIFETVFGGIWNFIKGIINTILGGIESLANGIISGLNFMIKALNKLSFEIPDWVPELGGKRFGFNLPSIEKVSLPRLAEGGYVKANQPQPVIVGDNRTQGEIISPEGKMLEVVKQALEQFFASLMNAGYNNSQQSDVGDIVIPIYLDGTLLDETIVTAQQRRSIRSGGR